MKSKVFSNFESPFPFCKVNHNCFTSAPFSKLDRITGTLSMTLRKKASSLRSGLLVRSGRASMLRQPMLPSLPGRRQSTWASVSSPVLPGVKDDSDQRRGYGKMIPGPLLGQNSWHHHTQVIRRQLGAMGLAPSPRPLRHPGREQALSSPGLLHPPQGTGTLLHILHRVWLPCAPAGYAAQGSLGHPTPHTHCPALGLSQELVLLNPGRQHPGTPWAAGAAQRSLRNLHPCACVPGGHHGSRTHDKHSHPHEEPGKVCGHMISCSGVATLDSGARLRGQSPAPEFV